MFVFGAVISLIALIDQGGKKWFLLPPEGVWHWKSITGLEDKPTSVQTWFWHLSEFVQLSELSFPHL